jgi:HNH endonuclease
MLLYCGGFCRGKTGHANIPQLPPHSEIRKAAFEYILSERPYSGAELGEAVASKLRVPEHQLKLTLPNKPGQSAFRNYVDHVSREFTTNGIHRSESRKDRYRVTPLGLGIARLTRDVDESQQLIQQRLETPTASPSLLRLRVQELLRKASEEGRFSRSDSPDSDKVLQVPVTGSRFVRKPGVVAQVLLRANGFCEVCDAAAPFQDLDASPFLEVHHVRPLASGGPDLEDNAVAACPNCHRELHFGMNRERRQQGVIQKKNTILIDYPPKHLY